MRAFHTPEHLEKLKSLVGKSADIHREIAAWAWEIPPEEVTKEQRRAAKSANFYYLYSAEHNR